MRHLNITLRDIEPITLNHAVKPTLFKNKIMMYKTHKARKFNVEFDKKILEYKKEIDAFNKEYIDGKHCIKAEYIVYRPILTKKGTLSKKSGDWDGYIKYLQDCLFNHLDADDSQIVHGTLIKVHSDNFRVTMNLYLRDVRFIN